MIRNGRVVTLGDRFVSELALAEKYVGRISAGRGRKFVSDVSVFLFEILAPLPLAFPVYAYPMAPNVNLRRAVFRREYVIIYEVTELEVSFLYFHHTSRNSPDLSFLSDT